MYEIRPQCSTPFPFQSPCFRNRATYRYSKNWERRLGNFAHLFHNFYRYKGKCAKFGLQGNLGLKWSNTLEIKEKLLRAYDESMSSTNVAQFVHAALINFPPPENGPEKCVQSLLVIAEMWYRVRPHDWLITIVKGRKVEGQADSVA